MSESTVIAAIDARGVARVTLNRPEKHNAFDDAVIAALRAAFDSLASRATCGWWFWLPRARTSAPGRTWAG